MTDLKLAKEHAKNIETYIHDHIRIQIKEFEKLNEGLTLDFEIETHDIIGKIAIPHIKVKVTVK